MKVLVAIMSCARDVANGTNQTIRDTWLKFKDKAPGLDYKFFVGNGQPKPLEEEHPLFQSHYAHFLNIKPDTMRPPDPLNEALLTGDEIILPVADGYPYLVYKVRESRRWALEQGYDFIFKCDTDTYVVLSRLLQSGFHDYDYIGFRFLLMGGEDVVIKEQKKTWGYYAQGGPGYWLSKSAYQKTIDAPIITLCEDVWTGLTLHLQGTTPRHDPRYGWGTIRNPRTVISIVNLHGDTQSWMRATHQTLGY